MHFESSYAYARSDSAMRGPGPRSYVPSMGTQAFTRFSDSNIEPRSTERSRTTGNFASGSSFTGCSSESINAVHAIRATPLTRIAHDPHTSSRHARSYTTGEVGLPSRVFGFLAISINTEMTFSLGR